MISNEEKVKSKIEIESEKTIESGKIGNTLLKDLIKTNEKYDLTTAAKNIKKIVKDLCPENYLIKIKSSRYAGGDSVSIDIIHDKEATDIQRAEIKQLAYDIGQLLKIFRDTGFDGMDDSHYTMETPFNESYGSTSYIHCKSRPYSKEEYESFKKNEKKNIEKEKKILLKALKKSEKKELSIKSIDKEVKKRL